MGETGASWPGQEPVLLRRIRLLSVIEALREAGPTPLTVLATQTGLSRPIIQSLADELVEMGWLSALTPEELGASGRTVGRPARRFRFHAEAGLVAGLDIGAHAVTGLVTDLDGAVRGRARLSISPATAPAERLDLAHAALTEACAAAGTEPTRLWQLGVASTGVIDHDGRVMLSVALPGWTGVDIAGTFAAKVGCPVIVENDGRAAALAEQWRGMGRGVEDMVYVHAGLRTGTGIIVGGRMLRGHSGAAGEIGALPAAGWAEAPMHLLHFPGIEPDARPEQIAEFVFSRARAGDEGALAATQRYIRALSGGIAALVLTFDPELVVVGGGISRSADLFLGQLVAELERVCVRMPKVVASPLDAEWVALGAVRVALDAVQQRYFSATAPDPLARPGQIPV
ncbi:ROK family protein [Actinospica durhamensis]|uniref:ROK family protein n=1 Tax=Actinospica durhamensis TaxID=1508375 RepID=A0A941EQC5_9ACTN|nr:ROK family protein [Actinospica durhamensis]MBR7835435.1 ROK family protein [Actinospica durhamensis]